MDDESKPPIALTLCQILWIMAHLDGSRTQCHTREGCKDNAAAAVTNLLGWLGWLRSNKLFSLTWGDVTITRPADGPRLGLPAGIGAIELRLLPETKSTRTKVADVVISYVCASGLASGLWLERLQLLWSGATTTDPVICGGSGQPWESQYFRCHHLYVWLHTMRAEGDPFLQAFTHDRGQRIEDKYYSFGTYRRGGRSSSTKRNNGTKQAYHTLIINKRE
jgi:hypothetical protein